MVVDQDEEFEHVESCSTTSTSEDSTTTTTTISCVSASEEGSSGIVSVEDLSGEMMDSTLDQNLNDTTNKTIGPANEITDAKTDKTVDNWTDETSPDVQCEFKGISSNTAKDFPHVPFTWQPESKEISFRDLEIVALPLEDTDMETIEEKIDKVNVNEVLVKEADDSGISDTSSSDDEIRTVETTRDENCDTYHVSDIDTKNETQYDKSIGNTGYGENYELGAMNSAEAAHHDEESFVDSEKEKVETEVVVASKGDSLSVRKDDGQIAEEAAIKETITERIAVEEPIREHQLELHNNKQPDISAMEWHFEKAKERARQRDSPEEGEVVKNGEHNGYFVTWWIALNGIFNHLSGSRDVRPQTYWASPGKPDKKLLISGGVKEKVRECGRKNGCGDTGVAATTEGHCYSGGDVSEAYIGGNSDVSGGYTGGDPEATIRELRSQIFELRNFVAKVSRYLSGFGQVLQNISRQRVDW